MSKVLLSFLGTGPKKDVGNASIENRQYKEAKYKFSDEKSYTTPFITEALTQYYDIDKIILIGTPHSMWEAVYERFSKLHKIAIDEDYLFELYEFCQNANHASSLSIPHPERIERALGSGSKVVLIHYGLDNEQLNDNIRIVMEIEQYLNSNDELYIDITHSFRSLPVYVMNLLMYLKYVSKRNINISNVSYGMLDVMREFNDTVPVINLTGVINVMEWIVGAYSFREFANAYKISSLLKEENPSVAQHLHDFSEFMNFNHLYAIQTEVSKFEALRSETFSVLPQLVVEPIIREFTKRFKQCHTHSAFQVQLARWQMEHYNYSSAYMSLSEAFITYACELKGLDWQNKTIRNEMKKTLYTIGLQKQYKEVANIRNGLTHQKVMNGRKLTDMLSTLERNIIYLEQLMK